MKRLVVIALVLVLCMAGVADARSRPVTRRARAATEPYELGVLVWYSMTARTSPSVQFSGPDGGAYMGAPDLFVFRIPKKPHGPVVALMGEIQSVSEDAAYITVKVRPQWESMTVTPQGEALVRGLARITL